MFSCVGVRILVKPFLRRPPVYRIELVTTLEGRGGGVQNHLCKSGAQSQLKRHNAIVACLFSGWVFDLDILLVS